MILKDRWETGKDNLSRGKGTCRDLEPGNCMRVVQRNKDYTLDSLMT